jgi:LPS-assembly protein
MKNKIATILLLLSIFFFINFKEILAKEFLFNTESIEILNNGNIISAKNGVVKSLEDKIEINSKKFYLDKSTSILKASNGVVKFLDTGITVEADNLEYNNILSVFFANRNVTILDNKQQVSITSENIFFDNKKKIIISESKTTINDKFGNNFKVESFSYSLNDDLIKINDATLIDTNNNIFNLDKAYLNLVSGKLIAKDVSINFNNQYFQTNGDPRLTGTTLENDEKQTIVKNGTFTPCKKNGKCPPWQISAEKIKHDKKKKTLYYKNAWLEIYDKPVLYLPKFFHPDPTVKRQSGFLMPSFDASNNTGSSFNIPYYIVLAENKDFTIRPRFFSNKKMITQSEYRSINSSSELNADISILSEQNSTSKSHIFLETSKKLNLNSFSDSDLSLNLQKTSNDTYLKTYKISSPLINNPTFLTSSLDFNAYKDDLSLDVSAIVYEDLNKKNNDKFEFIYPTFNINKKIANNSMVAGKFDVNSSGFIKHYNTNTFEKVLINDLTFSSDSFLTSRGFKNDFKILFKNINTNGKNSLKYKNTTNNELTSILQINSSYPLKKRNEVYVTTLKPITSLKFSPYHNKKSFTLEDRRIDLNSVYSLNRIAANDAVEGGASLTYGLEYKKNLTSNNAEVFNAKLANVLRVKENKNLPGNNDLGKKTSDFFGNLSFIPNSLFKIDYDISIDSDLDKTKYQSLESEINVNNFVTSFQYLNENNTIDSQSYLSNKTSYNFNESKNLAFETRKNKKTNMTEFYNLIYQYKNDCLIAAIEYNRDYYTDRDLKPEENIFFKLTIIPFGETSSPNLR